MFRIFLVLRLIKSSSIFHRSWSTFSWLISFILFWLPTECEPQGNYNCEQNPKCYHRTIKSSPSIESWSTNNHSLNNDLLLWNCCGLNCLDRILTSIWPNPDFNIFHHQKYERKWFLKKYFDWNLTPVFTIVRFCILLGILYWLGKPAVHIQLLSHVVWAIPLTISCFSCSIYWPVWRNRWYEFPTIPTIVGIQLSSPLYFDMKKTFVEIQNTCN